MNKVFMVEIRAVDRDTGRDDAAKWVYSNKDAAQKRFNVELKNAVEWINKRYNTNLPHQELPLGISYWIRDDNDKIVEVDTDDYVDFESYEWRVDYTPGYFEIMSSWEDQFYDVYLEEVEVLDE